MAVQLDLYQHNLYQHDLYQHDLCDCGLQVLAVQQKEDKLKKQNKDLQAERDQAMSCFVACPTA